MVTKEAWQTPFWPWKPSQLFSNSTSKHLAPLSPYTCIWSLDVSVQVCPGSRVHPARERPLLLWKIIGRSLALTVRSLGNLHAQEDGTSSQTNRKSLMSPVNRSFQFHLCSHCAVRQMFSSPFLRMKFYFKQVKIGIRNSVQPLATGHACLVLAHNSSRKHLSWGIVFILP